MFIYKIALDIVQMQNCTEYCSNAILHWILFNYNIALNIVQMQHLAVQRCTACGSWWGEMELRRLPGSQLPMKMSDHFGAIINAIMHFKIYWCHNVFQKLSIISHAFQILWMTLCISTIINAIMYFNNGALVVGGLRLADCNSRAPRAINDDFFFNFVPEINCWTHISFFWENDLLDLPARVLSLEEDYPITTTL